MFFAQKEKGQGLVEYAIILSILAFVVVCAVVGIWAIIAGVAIKYWSQIVSWGSNEVSALRLGDPTAIFIAALISVFVLWIIFRRRR